MRVLVCGGRTFGLNLSESSFINNTLDELLLRRAIQEPHIITGGARGVDTIANDWARHRGLSYVIYLADWNKYGKRAGYIRNKQMLDEGKPDLVVAFPGGNGTAMMVDISKKAGVEVIQVEQR